MFVLNNFKRKGIGSKAVIELFDNHKDNWKIKSLPLSKQAESFWVNIVKEHTNNNLEVDYIGKYHLIMNNDYLFRKQQELNILNSYLSKLFSIGKLNNVDQVLKIKNKIVDGIRIQSRNKFFQPLTNNNQILFKSEFFDYSYTYECFN